MKSIFTLPEEVFEEKINDSELSARRILVVCDGAGLLMDAAAAGCSDALGVGLSNDQLMRPFFCLSTSPLAGMASPFCAFVKNVVINCSV
jgi:hypothetical protein